MLPLELMMDKEAIYTPIYDGTNSLEESYSLNSPPF
ncbi:unnamed protein product, partial [marine sediment metagenome]